MSSVFSTSLTGADRVTASFLAALRCLSLDRVQRFLGALFDQPKFELVRFENLHSKRGHNAPDALIQSSVHIYVELTMVRDAVSVHRIKHQLARLDQATEETAWILVITPDHNRPSALDSIGDPRIAWTSFAAIDLAIDELLDDEFEVISEREAALLRELRNALVEEAVIGFMTKPLKKWDRNCWTGFFLELQKRLGDGAWDYVPNPNGDFMGYSWHWRDNKYLQLERHKLYFKIKVADRQQQVGQRDDWQKKIIAAAESSSLNVVRPFRIRSGTCMTVAVLDEPYRKKDSQGRIDMEATVSILLEAERLMDNIVSLRN
jgi:hypothetical protein